MGGFLFSSAQPAKFVKGVRFQLRILHREIRKIQNPCNGNILFEKERVK
jgi:hypothetical protein